MTHDSEPEAHIDVATLKIALSDAARGVVLDAIHQVAERGDTATPSGLLAMLDEVIEVLRDHRVEWTHGAAENASPMPPEAAEGFFARMADDARSRFEHEVIRSFDGEITRGDAPALPASDAPGRIVVTLIVAARRELRDARDRTLESLEAVLDDIRSVTPEAFVALEVVWSPADDGDRMSLAAMQEVYPELFALGAGVA